MRRLTTLLTTAFFATTLIFGATAFAGEGHDGPSKRGKRGKRGARMAEALGLTPVQAATIEALRSSHKASVAPLKSEIEEAKAELKTLWTQPSPDRAAILSTTQEIQANKALLAEGRVDLRFAILAQLTPEQAVEMGEMKANKRGRRGGKGLHGRKGRKGGKGFNGRKGGKRFKGKRGGESTPTE